MLLCGFIQDDNESFIEHNNDYFNDIYSQIMNSDKLPIIWLDFKKYITNEFDKYSSYYKFHGYKFENLIMGCGCLLEQYLLVPIKDILKMDRYGFERKGSNCISRPIDFDFSINIEKYKDIEKIKIVFLLTQYNL